MKGFVEGLKEAAQRDSDEKLEILLNGGFASGSGIAPSQGPLLSKETVEALVGITMAGFYLPSENLPELDSREPMGTSDQPSENE